MSNVEERYGGDLRFGDDTSATWNIEKAYESGTLEEICEDFNATDDISY